MRRTPLADTALDGCCGIDPLSRPTQPVSLLRHSFAQASASRILKQPRFAQHRCSFCTSECLMRMFH